MKTTISADGETSEFLTTSRSLSVTLNSSGNGFDSGTVTLQVQDVNDGDWFDVHDWTTDGSNEVVIGKDRNCRFSMSGSTSPTVNIYHLDILDSNLY